MKKSRLQQGFSTLVVLATILVITAIGFGSWRVWHKQDYKKTPSQGSSATKTPGTVPSSKRVATADGKISVELPNTWKVYSAGLHEATTISVANNKNCVNIDDPSPCMYQADFLPNTIANGSYGSLTDPQSAISGDLWSLTVEKTQWTIGEAADQVGGFSQDALIAQSDAAIGSYDAHSTKGYYCKPHTNQCGMSYYEILHDGYLAVFYERITPVNGQSNPITLDSSYDAEFSAIVKSIKFNL